MKINFLRGLLRLWLVASFLWVIFAGVILFDVPRDARRFYESLDAAEIAPPKLEVMRLQAEIQRKKGKTLEEIVPSLIKTGEWTEDEGLSFRLYQAKLEQRSRAIRGLRGFAIMGLGLPLPVLALGAALFWAVRGFRS